MLDGDCNDDVEEDTEIAVHDAFEVLVGRPQQATCTAGTAGKAAKQISDTAGSTCRTLQSRCLILLLAIILGCNDNYIDKNSHPKSPPPPTIHPQPAVQRKSLSHSVQLCTDLAAFPQLFDGEPESSRCARLHAYNSCWGDLSEHIDVRSQCCTVANSASHDCYPASQLIGIWALI